MPQQRGFLEITFSNGTMIVIPNNGVKCPPKKTIINILFLVEQDATLDYEL